MKPLCEPCLEPLGFVHLSKVDSMGIATHYKNVPVYKHPGRFIIHEGILYENQHQVSKGHLTDFYCVTLPKPTEI